MKTKAELIEEIMHIVEMCIDEEMEYDNSLDHIDSVVTKDELWSQARNTIWRKYFYSELDKVLSNIY